MTGGIAFDASIYIRVLRQGQSDILRQRNTLYKDKNGFQPLWLSAVVLEELYVGASDRAAIKALTKFEKDFTKINRLLVPNQADWSVTGRILNKIGEKYGFEKVGKARLTNDTLLSLSASRIGLTLLTANAKDFSLIAEFCGVKWEII